MLNNQIILENDFGINSTNFWKFKLFLQEDALKKLLEHETITNELLHAVCMTCKFPAILYTNTTKTIHLGLGVETELDIIHYADSNLSNITYISFFGAIKTYGIDKIEESREKGIAHVAGEKNFVSMMGDEYIKWLCKGVLSIWFQKLKQWETELPVKNIQFHRSYDSVVALAKRTTDFGMNCNLELNIHITEKGIRAYLFGLGEDLLSVKPEYAFSQFKLRRNVYFHDGD